MASTTLNSSLSYVAPDLASRLAKTDFTVVSQNIMCAYPISDIYAPTPRYLYYVTLLFTFVTIRYRWLSHIFLGASVAYAATAAIHAFIILANPVQVASPQNVTIPFIPTTSNLTKSIDSLVTNTSIVTIQPDAVELDIDPITAVVVTAYLVGAPLQIWSRTMRSSNIMRYMILLWNIFMLGGTISALVSWPTTNLAAPQYRFCYAGVSDDSVTNDGWDSTYWKGTWNASVWGVFGNPDTVWQNLSTNCFYPCFNTSQVIRQQTSLKAVVSTPETKFAKLHNPYRYGDDEFRPLVYFAIILFSAAQAFLYLVSVLKLGSEALRHTIHEPTRAWEKRLRVGRQLKGDAFRSWITLKAICALCSPARLRSRRRISEKEDEAYPDTVRKPTAEDLLTIFRLIMDVLALFTVFVVLTLFPVVVVAFICWIEWYIRNDGSTNETISQVGQWAPLVSVTVVLFASVLYQLLHKRLATEEEMRREMREMEIKIRGLKGELETRYGVRDDSTDEVEMMRVG